MLCKTRMYKKVIAMVLTMVFAVSCFSNVFADIEEPAEEPAKEVYVDERVLTDLESKGETYVVIWIKDIDKKDLMKRIEESTGMAVGRLIMVNTDLYISENRRLGKEMRSAKVAAVVNDLQLPEENIISQGTYVPIIIAKITQNDLSKLKAHDQIASVDYVSEQELFATPQDDWIDDDISLDDEPFLPNETEPLVLSLKGEIRSTMNVRLMLPVDSEIGNIDLVLHYNPEILEWYRYIALPDIMPTPVAELIEPGLLHVTLDCKEHNRIGERIYPAYFQVRGAGDPQIYLTEAKVYDKNGNEMSLGVENAYENTEITSDITWRYADEEDCLYIGGEGIICDYRYYDGTEKSEVKTPWHDVGSKAKNVVIQEGVTEVSEYAFDGFSQLESIEIADSVTVLPDYLLDDSTMNPNVVLRGKAPGPVELYSNKGFQFEPTNEVLRGDVNDDGQFTAEDALRILQEAAQLEEKHRCTGDYNTDGQVTAEDALGVLQEAAKLL